MGIWLVVVVALLMCVLMAAAKKGGGAGKKDSDGVYKATKLMTENEREFFGRLVVALPAHYVFPQVAMSALIVPASPDKATAHADRLRVAQQRVDFVICDRACNVTMVVELDDRTHQVAKDQRRDARLNQGAIRTVRFQSKNKPDAAAIRAAVLGPAAVAPVAMAAASA